MANGYATDQEILGHHLSYEFAMLRQTHVALETGLFSGVLANALIESFCIHARQLIEFFNNRQGRRAEEFTGGSYAPAHLSSFQNDELKKLNTQIAHLTAKRTMIASEKIGPADRATLLVALELEAQHFANLLSSEFEGLFVPSPPMAIVVSGGKGASSHPFVG